MTSDQILAYIVSAAINFLFLGVGGSIFAFFIWLIKRFIVRDASRRETPTSELITAESCKDCNEERRQRDEKMMQSLREDRHLRDEEMMQVMRSGYADLKEDMRTNIKDFKDDVRKDIKDFKGEVRNDVVGLHMRFDDYLKDKNKKPAAMESMGS